MHWKLWSVAKKQSKELLLKWNGLAFNGLVFNFDEANSFDFVRLKFKEQWKLIFKIKLSIYIFDTFACGLASLRIEANGDWQVREFHSRYRCCCWLKITSNIFRMPRTIRELLILFILMVQTFVFVRRATRGKRTNFTFRFEMDGINNFFTWLNFVLFQKLCRNTIYISVVRWRH